MPLEYRGCCMFAAYRTALEMIRDRGGRLFGEAIASAEALNKALEGTGPHLPIAIAFMPKPGTSEFFQTPTWLVFVAPRSEEEKIGVKWVRELLSATVAQGVKHTIVVRGGPLTVSAVRELDSGGSGMRVEVFSSTELSRNPLRHLAVPRHVAIPPADMAVLCETLRIPAERMPRILCRDPIIRYMGLPPGYGVRVFRRGMPDVEPHYVIRLVVSGGESSGGGTPASAPAPPVPVPEAHSTVKAGVIEAHPTTVETGVIETVKAGVIETVKAGVIETHPRIAKLRFGILPHGLAAAASSAEVCTGNLYKRALPRPGGLLDHRLGSIDRRVTCGSCGGRSQECIGHVGNMRLFPVYHPMFLDKIVSVLRSVCFWCSELIEDDPARARRACPRPNCRQPQPAYSRSAAKPLKIDAEWSPDALAVLDDDCRRAAEIPLHPGVVRVILRRVSARACETLGMCPRDARPESMVLVELCVPPPCIRPVVFASEGSRVRGQDDLTCMLQAIARLADAALRAAQPGHAFGELPLGPALDALVDDLQVAVAGYIHHAPRTSQPFYRRGRAPHSRSLSSRIVGVGEDKGRIRGNLNGKRCNFTGRAPISPDPLLDLGEVGVPRDMAAVLTVPVAVTASNLSSLQARARDARGGGVVRITTRSGATVELSMCATRERVLLRPGDTVHRTLADGDVVLFNRQPTLTRAGLMSHRVRVVPGVTLRMNVSAASAYAADFDGDEMNIHVPQNIVARSEATELMAAETQVLSSQHGRPTMAFVQDTLLGLHLLSRADAFLTAGDMMGLLMWVRPAAGAPVLPPPALLRPRMLWTGAQLIGALLPPTLTLHSPAGAVIVDGELLRGPLGATELGRRAGGVVHAVCARHGGAAAAAFISDTQRVVQQWLLGVGFSVGISDCVMLGGDGPRANHAVVRSLVGRDVALADGVGAAVAALAEKCGVPASRAARDAAVLRRRMLAATLGRAGSVAVARAANGNRLMAMEAAGSKGSAINLAQIMACVGQQSVNGADIPTDDRGRTLSSFAPGDHSAASRGFVDSSYMCGLRPAEFFFHQAGGREGLVDTAVKTAETGYLQRRLVKGMESLTLSYIPGVVCNAEGFVVQLSYGADGRDGARVERCPIDFVFAPPSVLEAEYLSVPSDYVLATGSDADAAAAAAAAEAVASALDAERRALLKSRRQCRAALAASLVSLENRRHAWVAANPERLLTARRRVAVRRRAAAAAAAAAAGAPAPPASPRATPAAVVRGVAALCADIVRGSGVLSPVPFALAAVRGHLTSRAVCLGRVPLSLADFAALLAEVRAAYAASAAQPGEMVGIVAAQAIGEPCTQMTLNTFHTAGIAEMNGTSNIARVKELCEATRRTAAPHTTARLRRPRGGDAAGIRRDAAALVELRLEEVILSAGPAAAECGVCARGVAARVAASTTPPVRCTLYLTVSAATLCARGITPLHLQDAIVAAVARRDNRASASVVPDASSDDAWEICVRSAAFSAAALRALVSPVHVGGIPGVRSAEEISVVAGNAGAVGEQPFLRAVPSLLCRGGSLRASWNSPAVDWRRTWSSDIRETYETLGLEAAIHVLLVELRRVMDAAGANVLTRHLLLQCEAMTFSGELTGFTRHFMGRSGAGVLQRGSFEQTMDILSAAALAGKVDPVKDITSNICLGQLAPIGTGSFDIFPDSSTEAPPGEIDDWSFDDEEDENADPDGGYGGALPSFTPSSPTNSTTAPGVSK